MAGATLTRYDASRCHTGGGDEKALQSRRKASQGATPQSVEAEGRQCAKTQSNRRSAADDSETEVARLTRERDEALEQQAATAEILRY